MKTKSKSILEPQNFQLNTPVKYRPSNLRYIFCLIFDARSKVGGETAMVTLSPPQRKQSADNRGVTMRAPAGNGNQQASSSSSSSTANPMKTIVKKDVSSANPYAKY